MTPIPWVVEYIYWGITPRAMEGINMRLEDFIDEDDDQLDDYELAVITVRGDKLLSDVVSESLLEAA